MASRDISNGEPLALRTIRQATDQIGEWPVFDYVQQELELQGIADPGECLQAIDSGLVRFESPLGLSTPLRLSAAGWDQADPGTKLIHDGFVTSIRQCVERVRHEKPKSPNRRRELVVPARDLWKPDVRSHLRLIGLLLEEVPGLGQVTWDRADTASPFKIKLNPLEVRRYASVGFFADFLSISGGSPSLQVVA